MKTFFVKCFFYLMLEFYPIKNDILKFLPEFANRNINKVLLTIEVHVYIIDYQY
jgi:hypothetical protein